MLRCHTEIFVKCWLCGVGWEQPHTYGYRQTSNMSHTKSQNLNVSSLALQLSLPNPLKPIVKSRMKT